MFLMQFVILQLLKILGEFMPYIPHTKAEVQEMLARIGVTTIEDLFADIEPSMRPKSFDLPKSQSEMAVCAHLDGLAAKNDQSIVSFLGAGFYDHSIPKAVDALTSRGEFYTAYTPYQPEFSQGTLQAIFEYQTAVTRLFGMDCSNASVYDGGSALFEAVLMAVRQTKRNKIIIDGGVNPIWRRMVQDYCSNLKVEITTVPHAGGRPDFAALKAAVDTTCAAIITQNPNFFGAIEDYSELFAHAKSQKVLSVISVYPVMQAVMKTAGEMGADVAVADGQALGMPLSFGGPYLGIMTCRKEYIRQFPGRIAGRTVDVDGKTGYVLTLQAREQHIRRAKATSNICSNQSLCALRSIIYLSLLGTEGLQRVALLGMENARYAAEQWTSIKGVSLLHEAPYGNEFALRLPCSAKELAAKMLEKGFAIGFPVDAYYNDMDNVLLVACTEKTQQNQVDALISAVKGVLA